MASTLVLECSSCFSRLIRFSLVDINCFSTEIVQSSSFNRESSLDDVPNTVETTNKPQIEESVFEIIPGFFERPKIRKDQQAAEPLILGYFHRCSIYIKSRCLTPRSQVFAEILLWRGCRLVQNLRLRPTCPNYSYLYYAKPRYSSLLAVLRTMCLYAHAQSTEGSRTAALGNDGSRHLLIFPATCPPAPRFLSPLLFAHNGWAIQIRSPCIRAGDDNRPRCQNSPVRVHHFSVLSILVFLPYLLLL